MHYLTERLLKNCVSPQCCNYFHLPTTSTSANSKSTHWFTTLATVWDIVPNDMMWKKGEDVPVWGPISMMVFHSSSFSHGITYCQSCLCCLEILLSHYLQLGHLTPRKESSFFARSSPDDANSPQLRTPITRGPPKKDSSLLPKKDRATSLYVHVTFHYHETRSLFDQLVSHGGRATTIFRGYEQEAIKF